jgi:glycosyltransferase involved in cell wall biosynthesis
VIPCFNEEDCIVETIKRIRHDLTDMGSYELIVVDDGSTDRSAALLEKLSRSDDGLRVVRHWHNRGYGASLKTGIHHATADYVAITDADGTYPNDRIPDLLAQAADADMVIGSRTGPHVHYPLLRRIPKTFLRHFACWIAKTEIPDLNSGLRVFRRDVAKRLLFMVSDGFSFTTTITLGMLTTGYRVRYVPVNYSPRIGKSKIKPVRDTLNFVYLIFRVGVYFAPARTLFPLAVTSFLGFLAAMSYDVLALRNLTEKTILLLMLSVGIALFALMADVMSMVVKKIAIHDPADQEHARENSVGAHDMDAPLVPLRGDRQRRRAA